MEGSAFGLTDSATASVIRVGESGNCHFGDMPDIDVVAGPCGGFKIGGVFKFKHFDAEGNFIQDLEAKNIVPAAALDYILNTCCRNGTPVTALFMGLIDNSGFTVLASTDLMNSHTGWSENLSYSGGSRKSWAPGASTGGAGSLVNASAVNFVMTAAASIRGVFICSDASSNASGILLLSEAPFTTGTQAVNSGDTIQGTYTLGATSS